MPNNGACCCVPKVSLSPTLPCSHGLLIVHFHANAGSKYINVTISELAMDFKGWESTLVFYSV
jgi:hypothetical protein